MPPRPSPHRGGGHHHGGRGFGGPGPRILAPGPGGPGRGWWPCGPGPGVCCWGIGALFWCCWTPPAPPPQVVVVEHHYTAAPEQQQQYAETQPLLATAAASTVKTGLRELYANEYRKGDSEVRYHLTIPNDSKPGETITALLGGRSFTVTLPDYVRRDETVVVVAPGASSYGDA